MLPTCRRRVSSPFLSCLVLLPVLAVAGWFVESAGEAQIRQADDAPKPLSPEASRKHFQLAEDLRIDLVAAEPDIAEPTGMCFDARGRIFVCELHGYNLDGYYDILELNKTGKLDTAVRRIPASPAAEQRAARETYGTVRLLEDTDGDGRFNRSTIFADHLPPCYGVVPARDGVIVLCAPDIIYLADRQGAGKADVRETLFTGFGVGEVWSRISNPRWSPDNWIYAASGMASGGAIRGPHLEREVKLGNTCFRFKPDGSQIEPVTGGTSGFGLAIDDWGDRFLCTNQQHALFVAPLPYAALARNPYQAGLDPIVNICSYGHPAQVYPTSQPDPWRRKRSEQAAWVRFYGAAETTAGMMTSGCAPTLYLADLLPERYRGNLFACEPAQNLIHRCLLEPKGAGYTVRRAEQRKEFLTSTDPWFRPINLTLGPDGALYVVDMYREIIEDYSAIPRYLQQQYVESLRNGHDKGRIWRIAPASDPLSRARSSILANARISELLDALTSSNPWRRLTSQRLLVERGDRNVVPALQELARHGATPQARLHALFTLDGLGALTADLVERALRDEHFGVRWRALELSEKTLDKEPGLLNRVLQMVDDSHPKVRLQAAFSLGASRDPRVLPALAKLALRDAEDQWTRTAIVSAVPQRAGRLAAILLAQPGEKGSASRLLPAAASVVGARNDAAELTEFLLLIAGLNGRQFAAIQASLLQGLAEGLQRAHAAKELAPAAQQALERLLSAPAAPVRRQAFQVAGLVKLKDSTILTSRRAAAIQTLRDDGQPLKDRLQAFDTLQGAPLAELMPLQELLGARQPLEIQLAVVQAFADSRDDSAPAVLLKDWPRLSPSVQTAVVAALCGRQNRLQQLLDAIEKGPIDAASLPPLRQTQLLENRDKAIRGRARKLLAQPNASAERRLVLEQYRSALTLPRDPTRGRAVYEKQCMKCHKLDGRGFAVGPDLAAAQNRPDESLLVDLLDPSSTITAGFRTYTVSTRNGKLYTGVLANETATSITLRREQGAEDVILRREIEDMAASSKSLMPDGLEKEISPQDMADLLGYLRQVLRPGARKQ
jgi:putative membrane-bound dehydrogenase-like protein